MENTHFLPVLFRSIVKSSSNYQTIGISFKFLQEAIDEPLQNASMHTNVHSSPFVLHFIVFWSLLWRYYLQIVRQSGFPSSASKKQLTSHCRMLACLQMCIPHLFFCISSLFGHFCEEITFKLLGNQDFLQAPSRSSWRAIAECFHAYKCAFLTFCFAFNQFSVTSV